MTIKVGTRLQSQVCETQVIVVKSADCLNDLLAGGATMVPIGGPTGIASPDPALAAGNVMGKRYVDVSGAEVLGTKAGAGTLSIGLTPLELKQAAPLPASD